MLFSAVIALEIWEFKMVKKTGSIGFKGFTLAEVMIAVTVLGILSAMLIPAVMKLTPSNNKILFRKAYSTLSRAVNDMISDDEIYPVNQINSALSVTRGFNYTLLNSTPTYYATSKFCYLLADRLNITGSAACQDNGNTGVPGPNGTGTGVGTFTTSDGMFWSVYLPYSDAVSHTNANSSNANSVSTVQFPLCSPSTTAVCSNSFYTTLVTIDVNGTSKGPGCSTVAISNPSVSACTNSNTVPDIYQIGVRFDGKLYIPTTDTWANTILSDMTKFTN